MENKKGEESSGGEESEEEHNTKLKEAELEEESEEKEDKDEEYVPSVDVEEKKLEEENQPEKTFNPRTSSQNPGNFLRRKPAHTDIRGIKVQIDNIEETMSRMLDPPFFVDEIGFPSPSTTMKTPEEILNIMKTGTIMTFYYKKKKAIQRMIHLTESEDALRIGTKDIVLLELVREIRKGHKTRTFLSKKPKNRGQFNLSFSLIYQDNTTYDFSVPDQEIFNIWIVGLVKAIKKAKISNDSEVSQVKRIWKKRKFIRVKDLPEFLSKINFNEKKENTQKQISNILKNLKLNDPTKLTKEEFIEFVSQLGERKEINDLFYKYSSDQKVLDAAALTKFFKLEQGQTNMSEDASKMIIKFYTGSANGGLSKREFTIFMLSDLNIVYNPGHLFVVYQDMNHPLTHYFIESSHNTYLTGHQLKGKSSVDMYIRVLKTGCRCVELDCWDGPDGEPDILHGHTLVTRIKFKDVLVAIRDYAFVASPYPVILSIELHCSKPQQIKMATYFKEVFGDMLPPILTNKNITDLPSPEQLKYKILIKGKRIHTESVEEEDEDYEESSEYNLNSPVSSPITNSKTPKEVKEKDSKNSKDVGMVPPKNKTVPKSKLAKELSDLMYLSAVGFKGFESVSGVPYEMSSFGESKCFKLIEKHGGAMIQYNIKQFSRTYPKGKRVDSSNYNPVPAWTCGCQMVALNYQTPSEPMFIQRGKFKDNGSCGYLLKPPSLLSTVLKWNPKRIPESMPDRKFKHLTVEVLSARKLPKSGVIDSSKSVEVSINPFVVLEMHGVPDDNRTFKTATIVDNGFNPNWNEKFEFPISYSPLAILLIVVNDSTTLGFGRIGHYSVPVHSIQTGYRMVPLLDDNTDSKKIPNANLLCKFSLVQV